MERVIKDKEKTIKKYMNFLGFLYITLEENEKFNINEACIVHKINKRVPSVLKKRGILINESRNVWRWNKDYNPNPEMINSILKEVSTINAIQKKENYKYKEEEMKENKEEIKDGLELFLNYAYINCRMGGKFKMMDTLSKFNINKNVYPVIVPSIMKSEGKGRGSSWHWVSELEPSKDMAVSIEKKISKAINKPKKRGGKRVGAGRKPLKKEIISMNKNVMKEKTISKVSLFWGLFNYEKIGN